MTLRIVKSGTDFRDLSSFTLSLKRNPSSSSPRRYLINSISGQHLTTTPDTPTSEDVQALIDELLKGIGKTLDEPACFTVAEWDCRSEVVRQSFSPPFHLPLPHSFNPAGRSGEASGLTPSFFFADALGYVQARKRARLETGWRTCCCTRTLTRSKPKGSEPTSS